jgi:hypothetical protein
VINLRQLSLPRLGPGLALGLLILGLAADLGFVRHQRAEVVRCALERDQLRLETQVRGSQAERRLRLARALGGMDLIDGLNSLGNLDPVEYLNGVVSHSGLERLEMATQASTQTERLRRTRLFLRVSGRFGQILAFTRQIEQGTTPVTVDNLSIQERAEAPGALEARFEISVYGPLGDF